MSATGELRAPYVLIAGSAHTGAALTALSGATPATVEIAPSEDALDGEEASVRLTRGRVRYAGRELHLYATPDDARIDVVAERFQGDGAAGLILLLDNERPYPLRDMHFFIHSFTPLVAGSALALGIVRLQADTRYSLEDYHGELAKLDLRAPAFEVDAADGGDLATLTEALLLSAELRID